jgi:hypothetical protein
MSALPRYCQPTVEEPPGGRFEPDLTLDSPEVVAAVEGALKQWPRRARVSWPHSSPSNDYWLNYQALTVRAKAANQVQVTGSVRRKSNSVRLTAPSLAGLGHSCI